LFSSYFFKLKREFALEFVYIVDLPDYYSCIHQY